MFNHDTSRLNNFKPQGREGRGGEGKEALTLWRLYLLIYLFISFYFFFLMDHGKISDRINRASGEFSPLNENPERSNGWMDVAYFFREKKTIGVTLLRSCAKKHGVAKRLRDNLNLKLKGIRGDHRRA